MGGGGKGRRLGTGGRAGERQGRAEEKGLDSGPRATTRTNQTESNPCIAAPAPQTPPYLIPIWKYGCCSACTAVGRLAGSHWHMATIRSIASGEA